MKLYIGNRTQGHSGDTSRELMSMWEESKYCEIIHGETDDVYLWANEPNDILLYEYPRIDSYPGLPDKWNKGLFGNMQVDSPNAMPWIFWARRPRLLEAKIKEGIKNFKERKIKSVFLGKIENAIQYNNRASNNWDSFVEKFSMPLDKHASGKWPYTQEEYLDILRDSKFGLCLAGFGPKCNREIEYLGLGVVPIMTPGVDLSYHNKLKEGVHYIKVNYPIEISDVVNGMSESEWALMSENCREWYEANCSRRGSFDTTLNIIENIKR